MNNTAGAPPVHDSPAEKTAERPMSATQQLYERAKQLIPGGTQLFSKRPELFAPDQWPAYYREAHGVEVTDLDGRRYVDMASMGIGTCLLGYNDPDVTAAVVRKVQSGSMASLNAPEEVELAEMLLAMHPWAAAARFARSGGEAMAVAVRIARAWADRDVIAFCGYHGWHDWYLAANREARGAVDQLQGHAVGGLSPRGVASQLAGTACAFNYNDPARLAQIFEQAAGRVAAVVMEPTRTVDPEPGFLETVRELCDRHGALLVFDEITAGFRLARGGAHLRYSVAPDIAVFAKALGNGHPMAAIIGRAEAMQAAQGSFISSTYWTEGVGPVAALATLRKMQAVDVPAHVRGIAVAVREGLTATAARHGLRMKITGHPALTFIDFDHEDSLAMMTFFTAHLLEHGFLSATAIYPSLAHRQEHVDAYLAACDRVFHDLAAAVAAGKLLERIGGPVRHTSFKRLA